MPIPQVWRTATRRNALVWIVVGALLVALLAAGIILATGSTSPPPPPPRHRLGWSCSVTPCPTATACANPYLTPQIGLPPHAVSQGPSSQAYPSLVTRDLRLTMTVRPTNCHLVGDQLAISGAVADPEDNTSRDGQCPVPPQQARNLTDEIAVADLAHHPARLVLLQDGADDIHFSACLEYELARVADISIGLGTSCVVNGQITSQLATELTRVRRSVAQAIETVAPHAATVAVLDYYQPIPQRAQVARGSGTSGLDTNLVCAGLKPNASSTYGAAQLVLADLNHAIMGAVADARADHVKNVRLIDIAQILDGHGICTTNPWVFSAEPLPDTTLAADTEKIVTAKACTEADDLHAPIPCASLDDRGVGRGEQPAELRLAGGTPDCRRTTRHCDRRLKESRKPELVDRVA